MSPELRSLVDKCKEQLRKHMPNCGKCRTQKHEQCGFFMTLAGKILHFKKKGGDDYASG
jgi:hypothetical protein